MHEVTEANCLPNIDWTAPWIENWSDIGQRVLNSLCGENESLATILNIYRADLKFTFVDQCELNTPFTYETFIDQSNAIPTRQNVHDLLNGLSWIKYPLTKARMLGLQAAEVRKNAGIDQSQVRGAVRDAITVFDENGILLQADEQIWLALENKDWNKLFIQHRALWSKARVWIFGHALLEKLITPRLSITGHVLRLKLPMDIVGSDIDQWVSERIISMDWAQKPFSPLQVLGVPGWWEENDAPGFYENTDVFRPSR